MFEPHVAPAGLVDCRAQRDVKSFVLFVERRQPIQTNAINRCSEGFSSRRASRSGFSANSRSSWPES